MLTIYLICLVFTVTPWLGLWANHTKVWGFPLHMPCSFNIFHCHCRYNEDLELEDAVHTAILTLKVGLATV